MSDQWTAAVFERFFLASPDLMCLFDGEGYFRLVNPAFSESLGWSAEELIGTHFSDYVHPEDLEESMAAFSRQLEGERLLDVESRHRAKDGSYRRLQWRESGVEEGVIYSVARDVTERRAAEAALLESEAKARSVLQTALSGILTLDERGHLEEMNPAAERLFGWRADEVVGQHVRLLLPSMFAPTLGVAPGPRPQVETAGGAVVGTVRETEGRRKDGSTFPLELAMSDFQVGRRRLITGIVRDLSQRQEVLHQIREARAAAETANAEKSAFLSRMSHELRTPLNAVLGFAQLLELELEDSEQRESVSMIMTAGRHLLELINEVLDISRIEAGHLTLSLEPTRLADVVSEAASLLGPLARDRSVDLVIDVDPEHEVRADARRLLQVLINLMTNAVKYGGAGGEVRVSSSASRARVRVAVSDRGPGIAPEAQHRLFTPFERLGAGGGEIEGTGLGLALSKRLVEAMEGEIGVESEPGVGATFYVELARAEASGRTGGSSGGSERLERVAPELTGTVLYIEDQLSNQVLVGRILQRRPGLRLLSATEGQMGLALALEHRPDVILLDRHLPDLSGDQVIDRLRAQGETRDIPVVLVTADVSARESDELRDRGADAIILKPVDVGDLLGTIDRLLRRSSASLG